jgi:hypothetical protein
MMAPLKTVQGCPRNLIPLTTVANWLDPGVTTAVAVNTRSVYQSVNITTVPCRVPAIGVRFCVALRS